MFIKDIGNFIRVTDKGVIYFHFLYYLVLATRHEVINSFPSPSRVSFRLSKTIVIIGCLSGFHFIGKCLGSYGCLCIFLQIMLEYAMTQGGGRKEHSTPSHLLTRFLRIKNPLLSMPLTWFSNNFFCGSSFSFVFSPVDLFHNGGQTKFCFIFMLMSLTSFTRMSIIQKNVCSKMRRVHVGLINIHTKE